MKKIWLLIGLLGYFIGPSKAQDTTQHVVSGRKNAAVQQLKPYVILISIDAFQADFASKYRAKHLLALKRKGVSAPYMLSSFPTLTFPNHYTLATGLYPAHHGIVDNVFYDKKRATLFKKSDSKQALDSSWYGGKPLWVLAEQQQMLSAVYYWPGSEIAIAGVKPTYYYAYNEVIPLEKRINAIKEWLALPEQQRPHLIAFYLPQVDKAAHTYGPDSEETRDAVKLVDAAVGEIMKIAKKSGLPVNFVVVSDHGMARIDADNTLPLPEEIDLTHFKVPPGNALVQIYGDNKAVINQTYQKLKHKNQYTAYLHDSIPERWHFGGANDTYNRVGDLILVPKLPKVFSINGVKPAIGQHGFDPELKEMHATFYAWGPNLKSRLKVAPFENIHIYPFIANLLGLQINEQIDGQQSVLKSAVQ